MEHIHWSVLKQLCVSRDCRIRYELRILIRIANVHINPDAFADPLTLASPQSVSRNSFSLKVRSRLVRTRREIFYVYHEICRISELTLFPWSSKTRGERKSIPQGLHILRSNSFLRSTKGCSSYISPSNAPALSLGGGDPPIELYE